MEESVITFKIICTPDNLAYLEKIFGYFKVIKLKCYDSPPVLIIGFRAGKIVQGAKVPLRPEMNINTLEEVKTYLLESMLET